MPLPRPYAWLAILVVGALLCLSGSARAKRAPRPQTRTVVCHLSGHDGRPAVTTIVGFSCGDGWEGGEDLQGRLRKGDRLSLYYLTAGVLGSATLTDAGVLWSEQEPEGAGDGVIYNASLQVSAGKPAAYRRVPDGGVPMLALWTRGGARPRWVTAESQSPAKSGYRKVIAAWLTARKVPAKVLQTVVVEQILRADINGDGQLEVLLSLHTPDAINFEYSHERPTKSTFSYLLLRHRPKGSRTVRTTVLEDDSNSVTRVAGLCDLDGDGWAEIVTEEAAYESECHNVIHWTGRRFETVWGNGWSV